jgi:hypothetical protein
VRVPKKVLLAVITGIIGVLIMAVPAFAGVDFNHNETFLRGLD